MAWRMTLEFWELKIKKTLCSTIHISQSHPEWTLLAIF
jgi:hypothetical protein